VFETKSSVVEVDVSLVEGWAVDNVHALFAGIRGR
jgi:hypothetical protein